LRSTGDLVWAARHGSKPGRGNGEAWTLHADPHWSAERLEQSPEEIAPELLAALAAAVGHLLPTPTYLAAHRWRFALVEQPLGEPCVWDEALRLGLFGD
jgi:renalase